MEGQLKTFDDWEATKKTGIYPRRFRRHRKHLGLGTLATRPTGGLTYLVTETEFDLIVRTALGKK